MSLYYIQYRLPSDQILLLEDGNRPQFEATSSPIRFGGRFHFVIDEQATGSMSLATIYSYGSGDGVDEPGDDV